MAQGSCSTCCFSVPTTVTHQAASCPFMSPQSPSPLKGHDLWVKLDNPPCIFVDLFPFLVAPKTTIEITIKSVTMTFARPLRPDGQPCCGYVPVTVSFDTGTNEWNLPGARRWWKAFSSRMNGTWANSAGIVSEDVMKVLMALQYPRHVPPPSKSYDAVLETVFSCVLEIDIAGLRGFIEAASLSVLKERDVRLLLIACRASRKHCGETNAQEILSLESYLQHLHPDVAVA